MLIRRALSNPIGSFVERNLRGVGQVMLQNNPLTGLLFLVGIFVNDWVFGLYALLGTVVATESALLLGAPRDDVRQGLYGFNGTLVGVGLALYLRHDPILSIYVAVAAIFASVVMAAIQNIFGSRCPALTAPFVIVTWIFVAAVFAFGRLHGAPALGAPHLLTEVVPAATAFGPIDAVTGILKGLAQVMFQQSVWTGAIFVIALAVNSRISCVAAVLGSAIAIGIAWSLGAAPTAIRDGLYSFNAVLTAIAVGGLFFRLQRITVLFTILAVCVSTIFYAAFITVLSPLGLPALTAPFVITTWLFLFAGASLAGLRRLSPAEITTAEENLAEIQKTRSSKT